MKKFLTLKNLLIAIAFTVFLLLVKDNMDVVLGIIKNIISILTPFFLGFMIAYILNYPYKLFYAKAFKKMGAKHRFFLKLKKPLSIVCTYIVFFAVITALIVLVVPQIAMNIANLIESMPDYAKTAGNYIDNIFAWVNSMFQTDLSLEGTIQEVTNQLAKYFASGNFASTADATKNILDAVSNIVTSTASGLYNFLMSLIISIYFLSAKEQLCHQVKKLAVAFIPIRYLPKVYEIVDVTDTKCGRFLVGDILDAGLIGVLLYITMTIFQFPYAPMIAVLVGVTNIIPFFGPFIGGIPSALILLLVDPMRMVWFILILVIIQQLDGNVFKPKIIGNQLGISSFWVLFSVIVGGALFGLPGFILGTPIYAAIYTLVGKRVRNNIEDKGKIAQQALEFDVLQYSKIAAEQKRIRAEKEQQQMEKIKKLIRLDKFGENHDEETNVEKTDNEEK